MIRNYFEDLLQVCKVVDATSDSTSIDLGVPQGSVLGQLLFLIYINDLTWNGELNSLLFTDDTTLSESGNNLDERILGLGRKLDPLLVWIEHNQLMIISKIKDIKFY